MCGGVSICAVRGDPLVNIVVNAASAARMRKKLTRSTRVSEVTARITDTRKRRGRGSQGRTSTRNERTRTCAASVIVNALYLFGLATDDPRRIGYITHLCTVRAFKRPGCHARGLGLLAILPTIPPARCAFLSRTLSHSHMILISSFARSAPLLFSDFFSGVVSRGS
jgi:hypothetical protein